MKLVSYAQNFEDIMLWRAFKHVKKGFYIDVGAFDPDGLSITKMFYDNGWSGINIEPNHVCYEKFVKDRPRDINLNVFASDKEGKVDFFECSNAGLSTSIVENVEALKKELKLKFEKKVKNTKTLDTICAENYVREVNFLKVDVEGSEIHVLNGFSFDAVRPWIVLFESIEPSATHSDVSEECVAYLESKKYHQVYFDGVNRFFVADEHLELDDAFDAPFGILDFDSFRLDTNHPLIFGMKAENEEKINSLKNHIKHKDQEIRHKDQEIRHKDQEIRHKDQEIEHKGQEISEIRNTLRWKIPNYFYKIFLKYIKPCLSKLR